MQCCLVYWIGTHVDLSGPCIYSSHPGSTGGSCSTESTTIPCLPGTRADPNQEDGSDSVTALGC